MSGIAVRLPTKRGCRGGARKEKKIDLVIGHRPPTDRPHTRCNNNNLTQVPTVTRDSAVIVDKSKVGLINARSLRNKSLFVIMSTSVYYLTLLVLTGTWLTDDDTISVSDVCRDNFTLMEALDAVEVSESCSAKLSSSYRRGQSLCDDITFFENKLGWSNVVKCFLQIVTPRFGDNIGSPHEINIDLREYKFPSMQKSLS